MRNRLSLPILNALFVLFVFSSCQKEGTEGPEGPAGPQGPQGQQGQPGPAGPQGPAGTANVIYSDWLNVTFNENGIASISAPKLTVSMLATADIKVYWNLGTAADPFVVALPAVVSPFLLFDEEDLGENPPSIFVDPYFSETTITLACNYDISSQQGVSQFRYIIIPGGELALKSKNINFGNYREVQQYFNLKN